MQSPLRQPPPPLDEYRQTLAISRIESVDRPGVYFDGSPCGAGKNHADIEACRLAGTSLTVLPTHKLCVQVEGDYVVQGLDAGAYPELTEEICENHDEAAQAMTWGLSPSSAICPDCRHNLGCPYHDAMRRAEAAAHRIATHKRVELTLHSIANGRKYITIHERVASFLRPTVEICNGLKTIATIAHIAEGKTWGREDQTARLYFCSMETAAVQLDDAMQAAPVTSTISLPEPVGKSAQIEITLYRAIQESGVSPDADCMRMVRAIAEGDCHEVTVRVDHVARKGGETETRRSIVAVWKTDLPPDASVRLNDATDTAEHIRTLTDRHIIDATPSGRLATLHSTVQAPVDITRRTSPGTVAAIIRGVLARHPDAQRVGIICHRPHVAAIQGTARTAPALDAVSRSRIAKVDYFRGTQSRGSNSWTNDCDLLIVVGTPRVPPSAVRTRLIASGRISTAAQEPRWERDYWSGVDTAGKRHTVQARGYIDHDWHDAHQSIVRAELLQAVGRARGICEHGIPAVVVSTEEIGLPLVAWAMVPIAESDLTLLETILKLTDMFPTGRTDADSAELTDIPPTIDSLGGMSDSYLQWVSPIPTSAIAPSIGKTERQTVRILSDLQEAGLVSRIGQRGGWKLTAAGIAMIAPATAPNPTAAPSSTSGGAGDNQKGIAQ